MIRNLGHPTFIRIAPFSFHNPATHVSISGPGDCKVAHTLLEEGKVKIKVEFIMLRSHICEDVKNPRIEI